jgi:hypothetical protein
VIRLNLRCRKVQIWFIVSDSEVNGITAEQVCPPYLLNSFYLLGVMHSILFQGIRCSLDIPKKVIFLLDSFRKERYYVMSIRLYEESYKSCEGTLSEDILKTVESLSFLPDRNAVFQ